ncbi:MAG: phosphatidylserine decarboxylase [Bdellovibrionaceae bacterium]|nr:phosphatidylserine decarboxylase [Pseudobdellovibrionaceae bacterium]
MKSDYLEQFESETEETSYSSFSDFFLRKYKSPLKPQGKIIWPCEGYICDWGLFSEKNDSIVKGQTLDLNSIFASESTVTKDYFFINIFLHNHNYHRVHSMIEGQVTRITRVPGDLIFLRPWFYNRSDVSYPATRNERIIFEITDNQNRPWYLAMVGGFGVGTIEIAREFLNGGSVKIGQEIAKFRLGSTVCLASPDILGPNTFLQTITAGQEIEPKNV